MNFKYLIVSIALIISFMLPVLLEATKKVPAIYVFGDSLVDHGNGYRLDKNAITHLPPFGIDFGGDHDGRTGNGKTMVDYLAIHFGLPLVPAYLGLSRNQRKKVTTGINFACAAAAILPHTSNDTSLTFDAQIMLFKRNMKKKLSTNFYQKSELERHLSKSLFFINIGVNDYFEKEIFVGSKKLYTNLINEFSLRLKKLYSLGARKFLVNNLPPAGCFPREAFRLRGDKCVNKINNPMSFYNKLLPKALLELQNQLPGFTFILADLNRFILELRETGYKYGIVETKKPCCIGNINGDILCHPYNVTCPNRDTHLFWDDHPSQIVFQMYERRCLHEQTICSGSGLKHI